MAKKASTEELLEKIKQLENRLEESEQLIDAIRAGEVDAFAINGDGKSEIYTLQSGDYAYRVLIEAFGEGAINVSEDGLIVYTNPYFCHLLQLSYEKVIGSFILDFVHPDSHEEFKQIFTEAHIGKTKGEINLMAGGTIIPVYLSLTSLQPTLPTVGIIITDLTRRKKDETVILKYQKDLETKNTELTQSNAELASFAYIASHDLQEPLRKIQTFVTRLKEKESHNLSEYGKDYFDRMQNAANRMQILIEDLLSYSRTNKVERKFEYTDLNTIVIEITKDLREELQVRNAVIEVREMCHANVIPFQFRQLIHNLISNSLKFSIPGEAPLIKIKSERINGKMLNDHRFSDDIIYCHIELSDNGIGFEQQYSERIFELFQRLHGRSEYNGTGIGLAIVKKIVENHNGFIMASGESGKGAAFDIYIPEVNTL
jgi:PAS domain S-box-containing protein